MSLDGFIDDRSTTRLSLSNNKDFDRVDTLRATCDAILVGANTIRRDNPKLMIKSKARPKKLIKVTMTSSGILDSSSSFFTTGDTEKIIYTTSSHEELLTARFSSIAKVVNAGQEIIDLHLLLNDLYSRGIRRLIIEGGSSVLTQFLEKGMVNEMHIAIAGFFVGQKDAPKFVQPGNFPWNAKRRLRLNSVAKLDDMAILTYNA